MRARSIVAAVAAVLVVGAAPAFAEYPVSLPDKVPAALGSILLAQPPSHQFTTDLSTGRLAALIDDQMNSLSNAQTGQLRSQLFTSGKTLVVSNVVSQDLATSFGDGATGRSNLLGTVKTPRVQVGKSTVFTVSGLAPGTTANFKVKARGKERIVGTATATDSGSVISPLLKFKKPGTQTVIVQNPDTGARLKLDVPIVTVTTVAPSD